MKKTGIVLANVLMLAALLLNIAPAAAATDGYYNLSEASPASWDGTDGSSLKPVSSDNDYAYGDDASVTYTLPWNTTFYGQTFSSITADTNGNVWFNATGAAYSFNLANTGRGPVIAAWNEDLSSQQYGGVFIQHKTSPERIVIEWQTETYTEEGESVPNSFEVVIFQNGNIRFDYQNFTTQAGTDSGSGISRGDGSASLNLTTEYGNVFTLAGRSFLFAPSTLYSVNVTKDGLGSGSVTGTPTGISCGSSCSSSFAPGSSVTLTATPVFGSEFTGWSGACSGTGVCALTVDADKSVTATFGETYAPAISITSPAGTIATSRPTLNYTVSTGTVAVKVDGVAVSKISGDLLDPLADGPHVVRVEATNAAGHLGFAESGFTVDTTPPAVAAITPATGSSNVPVRMSVLVQFAEQIDPASVTGGTATLVSQGVPMPGEIRLSSDNRALIFKPQEKLNYAATYTFTLKAGLRDLSGNSIAGDTTITFSTPWVDPDLVGYWPMDGDWNDYSVNANNGMAYGSSAFADGRVPGVQSGNFVIDSAVFAGSGGLIDTPMKFIDNVPNNFTMSFWAKPTATRDSTLETTSGVSGTGNQRYAIAPVNFYNLGYLGATAGVSVGTNGISVFEETTINNGSLMIGYMPSLLVYDSPTPLTGWNHIAVVYANKQPSLYLNGVLVRTGLTSSQFEVYPAALFAFGNERPTGSYSGQLEGITIHKRALSAQEVQGLFQQQNRPVPQLTISSPGQTVRYRPDEAGSATVSVISATGIISLYCSASGATTDGGLAVDFEQPQTQTTQQLNFRLSADAAPSAPVELFCVAQTVDGVFGAGELVLQAADLVSPTVVSSMPTNNAIDASATMPITINFSEPIDPASVVNRDTLKFQRADNRAWVTAMYRLSTDNKAIQVLPSPALDSATSYTITLSRLRDVAGNVMASDYVLQFTTLQQASLIIENQGTSSSPYLLPAGRYGALTLNNSFVSASGGVTVDSLSMDHSTLNVSPSVLAPGNLSVSYGDMAVTSDSQVTVNGTLNLAANLNLTASAMSVTDAVSVTGNILMNSSTFTMKSTVQVTGDVSLQNNSILSHYAATTIETSKVDITAVNITIDSTSRIDASGKGYLGGFESDNTVITGRTAGNTTTGGSGETIGGSYGGIGGGYSTANSTYGDLTNPNELGSGGGGFYYDFFTGLSHVITKYAGGSGGGLIRLKAANLTLDGSIQADGEASSSAGGSGGGIFIDASSISGSGSISANGGTSSAVANSNSGYGGGGGGGRVALSYAAMSLPVENIHASGGLVTTSLPSANGAAGTILLKDTSRSVPDLRIDNDGISTTKMTPISGGDFGDVTVTGGALLSGNYSIGSDMFVENVQLTIDGALGVAGSLNLTNSLLNVSGEVTVPGSLTMNKGNLMLKDSLNVTGGITLQNQSVLSHYGATTTAAWKLDITAPTVTIDATSKIDVSEKGYLGGRQGGNWSSASGMTINLTDGSVVAGVTAHNGGGYGGLGICGTGTCSKTYGDLANPIYAGSGGGGDPDMSGSSGDKLGGNGGGILKLTAGTLNLLGTINADGGPGAQYGAGGSGGSVLFNVGSLTGTGGISAKGGAKGGGGGRVAIYYDSLTVPTANISAAGVGGGGAGTIYLKDNTKTKPALIVDNGGTATSYGTSVPGGDYESLTVKGGAIVSTGGGFTTEQDLSLTDTQLTVNGPLGLPGNLSLTNSTLNVSGGVTVPGSLTMNNASLTLKGTLNATGSITLQNQSVLSHYGATTTAAWKLDVTASMVSVDATSRIDVSGKGYLGGRQSGNWSSASGMTVNPANGSIVTGVTAHNGGGYGGLGACGTGTCSSSYGDQTNPLYAGSGGGGDPDMSGSSADKLGGNGGGILKLTAGTLSLAGSIKADGGPGAQYGAGGSGGSVLLNVGALTGSGSISAKGGAKGGGGGRIAIYYDSMTVPVGNISTTGGISGDGSNALDNGGAGTIYLKDNAKAKPALIIDNGGTATSYGTSVPGGNYLSFTSKGGAVVSASSGVTTEQDPLLTNTRLTVNGSLGLPGNLSLTNCTVSLTGSATVPGNLTMNNSSLTLRNILSVSGNISLQNLSVLAHEQTWLWSVWRLDITALTVTIDATSKIDVTGRGYLGGWQAYDGVIKGHTIGNVATVDLSQGGSYGGYGSGHSAGNSTYGSMTNPIDAGSGGGGGSCNPLQQSCFGGNGGGVVKITANSLSLAGDIKANGNPCNGYINVNSTCYGGSGSGGSVLLNVGTLSGSGRISANGGPGSSGGGGGRVAVYYDSLSLPVGNITSAGGLGGDGSNPANNGGAGTVYLLQNVLPLTVTKSGAGIGTVQSTPAGINCGATCSGNFVKNSNVTLTATPNAGSTFDGWSGACSGTGNCTVTMDAAKSATASFALIPPPTVTISSPVGVISNNRPLLQYSVSAGTVVVKVDGVVVSKVSGDPLDLLVDGLHTIRVEATNSGVTGYAESIVTIDTVVPAVTVDSLPAIVKAATQTLSGTMETGSSVSLTVAAGTATLGQVTYPTATTWQCMASSLSVGTNTFTVTARDQAGNSSVRSLSVTYVLPLALELSVPSITANSQGSVELTISHIDPAGSNVLVEQLVDANRNGVIDSGDYVIRTFTVTDGVTAANPKTQGDEDAISNGTIATTLSHALVSDLYHAPGSYLFRVTNGTETATQPFIVSPVTQLQYVAGTVTDGTNPVAGAIVRLLDKWQRPVAATVADETGHYTLDIATPGEYRIVPIAYGFAADPAGTPLTIADGQNLTGHNLTATAGTIHLSGKLKKDQTNDPVAGVWVQAIGANVLGYAITGTDGSYDLPLPAGEYDVIAVADATLPNPAARGYLAATKQPQHVNLQLDTAGIDIALVPADIVVTGKVVDQTGSPLSGVPILGQLAATADAREPAAFATTDGSGNYTLALAAGNDWTIALDDALAQPLGYLGNGIRNFTTAGTLTGNNLSARPVTAWVQGTVRDSSATPLANMDVQLRNTDSSVITHLRTAGDGTYRFGAYAGDWYLNAYFVNNGPQSAGEQTATVTDGQTATVDFTIDTVPPAVTISSPTATTTPDNTPKLTYTVSEGTVVVKVDGVVVNKVSSDNLDTLANGEHTVVVESTDSAGNINSASVTLIVNYAPLAISTSGIDDGTSGIAYSQTLAASGGVSPYDWTIIGGSLPAELALDRATGTISGTPGATGTYSFTVQVTDSDGVRATQPFTLTVYTQPTFTTAALADGYLSTAYGQTVSASGGKTPYSWSLIGSPPASLALDVNTGAITGIPTATGTSSFTVQVKDANNVTALMPLGITVYALPSITSASCPNGTVGTAYSCTLTATGGKTPLAWSISGSLPANLALNSDTGVISGTPTVAGTSNFTVLVADANLKSASTPSAITVAAPPAVASLNAWTNLYSAAPSNTSATNLNVGSFTVGSGTNRLLLVAVVMEIGTAANPTISASYGGVALTQAKVTANTQREIVWLGYLKESQIGSGSKALTVTYSGATGNVSALHVKWGAFSGVNQTIPIVASGGTNTASTSATFGSTINYVVNGMTTVVAGNGGTPATGTLTATPPFTAGAATTTNAQTSRTFTTAKHTTNGSYAGSTAVTWSGTTSSRSGVVVVSLQP